MSAPRHRSLRAFERMLCARGCQAEVFGARGPDARVVLRRSASFCVVSRRFSRRRGKTGRGPSRRAIRVRRRIRQWHRSLQGRGGRAVAPPASWLNRARRGAGAWPCPRRSASFRVVSRRARHVGVSVAAALTGTCSRAIGRVLATGRGSRLRPSRAPGPVTTTSPPACPSTSWGRVASPTRGTAPWPGTSTATPTPSSRAAGSSMRLLEPRYTPSKRARGTAETDPRALRPAAAMQPNSGRPRVGGRAVGGERPALIEAATSEGVSADYRAVATSRARGLSAVPLNLAPARRRRGSVTTPVTATASDA